MQNETSMNVLLTNDDEKPHPHLNPLPEGEEISLPDTEWGRVRVGIAVSSIDRFYTSVLRLGKTVYIFAFLIFIFNLLLIPSAQSAVTDWTVHVKVSVPDPRGTDGTIWNHLIAGVRHGASDGFDSAWDTASMVEIDDPVQSMFMHGIQPEDSNNDGTIDKWACKNKEDGYPVYGCSLWRDIRTFGGERTWSFVVLSTVNGGTITLNWNFEYIPKDIDISLVDLSFPSDSIDMEKTGLYLFTNTFNAGKKYGIRYFEIRMKAKGLFMGPPDLPDATLGTLYDNRVSVINGDPVWSLLDGRLPEGMSLDVTTGQISGTPSETGTFKFTLKGVDRVTGNSKTQEFTLNINSIPKIDTFSLSDGVLGNEYSDKIAVTGGSKPIAWFVTGNLPEGLMLDGKTGVIYGTPLVPGIYNFTISIKDANNAVDSMDYQLIIIEPADKTPPDKISDLRVAHLTNNSVLLIWSAPLDDSVTHTAAIYDIRFIENCVSPDELNGGTWDNAVEVTGEPRPQIGAIQTYSLSGIKAGTHYCIAIRSRDAIGHVSAVSNVVTLPLSPDVNISNLSELTSTVSLSKGYNLISIPLIPVLNERESIFSFTVGSPVSLYRWYSAYPDLSSPRYYLENIVQPGLGYFIYSPADNLKLVISGLEIEDKEYSVGLQNGWNMVGNPYNKSVPLADIMVRKTSSFEIMTYIDAVKAGWIGNSIYQLKDGNYDFASFNDDPPAMFEPWLGYWVHVNEEDGVEIIFRRQ
ncbi:MAG: putative Ig domain-containing protein [Nitrospirae bacterium]|nr:putative Ig domain-containing protein [Nitrospirota bacterium]